MLPVRCPFFCDWKALLAIANNATKANIVVGNNRLCVRCAFSVQDKVRNWRDDLSRFWPSDSRFPHRHRRLFGVKKLEDLCWEGLHLMKCCTDDAVDLCVVPPPFFSFVLTSCVARTYLFVSTIPRARENFCKIIKLSVKEWAQERAWEIKDVRFLFSRRTRRLRQLCQIPAGSAGCSLMCPAGCEVIAGRYPAGRRGLRKELAACSFSLSLSLSLFPHPKNSRAH
ncbi:MAG: hypothetical protein A4E38_00038 [Methanoregulaceae archaeon PtaB.Bin108]|nr:MAG: hypothetical protein A4E38_00038 [Methanoregulaceae archaeon PtaB.Bin108]